MCRTPGCRRPTSSGGRTKSGWWSACQLDWEQTLSGGTAPRRSIAALRFDRVLACKSRNIDLEAPEAVLELVGIEFHPGEAPGGSAMLLFSHGGALRLDVECLECELTDLGTDDLGAGDFAIAPRGGRLKAPLNPIFGPKG
jgi:hypothetical protein